MKRSLILLLLVPLLMGQDYNVPFVPRGGGANLSAVTCVTANAAVTGDCGAAGCANITDNIDWTLEFLFRGNSSTAFRLGAGAVTDGGTRRAGIIIDGTGTNDVQSFAGGPLANDVLEQDDTIWHRWTLTHAGPTASQQWRFYIDGVEKGAPTSISGIGTGDNWVVCGHTTAIGVGSFADFRIWSDVRTPTEVADHSFCQLDPTAANLEVYWPMNEGTGNAIDLAGGTGTADGVLSGNATWVTQCTRGACTGILDELDDLMTGTLADGADCL